MPTRDSMVKAPQVFGLRSGASVETAPTNLVKKDWTLMKVLSDGDLTVTFKDDVVLAIPALVAGSDFGIHDVKLITFTGQLLLA